MAAEYRLSYTAQEIDEKLGKIKDIDQTYDSESENAQSGKALSNVLDTKQSIYYGTDIDVETANAQVY